MHISSLDGLQPEELFDPEDRAVRHRSDWPTWGGEGAQGAACYFEIDPGSRLGAHTHDAEETVFVFEGTGKARIEDEVAEVDAPALVVMPQGKTHDVVNTGATTLRAVGFFPAPSVTTIFDRPLQPSGSRRQGTPDVAAD